MSALLVAGIVFFLAFLTETLVEFGFGTLASLIVGIWPGLKPVLMPPESELRAGIIQLSAIAVGIVGAFIYKFDLVFLLGAFIQEFGTSPLNIPITTLGLILTGISIGKGSNYLHNIIQKFFVKPVG